MNDSVMKYRCEQRGCGEYAESYFDDAGDERNCPVCANPLALIDSSSADDGLVPWSDYRIKELREYAADWNLEGVKSNTSKPDLIALLEAADTE